jgi:hypothetical protein
MPSWSESRKALRTFAEYWTMLVQIGHFFVAHCREEGEELVKVLPLDEAYGSRPGSDT